MFDSDCSETAQVEFKSADALMTDMPSAPNKPLPPRYRPRRSTSDRLRDALLALAGGAGELTRHEEAPWSSITFTGTRHEAVFEFTGHTAVEAGETFMAQLPDHEFRIPGQLVADASVREVDHRFGAEERLIVTAVLLLLEEV